MNEPLNNLITALREELQQFGELLARLDQQQESSLNRHAEEMIAATTSIQIQATVIQSARRHREDAQRQVARELRVAESAPFAELIPLLPEDYRPLVQSLVEENNSLLARVQQRARQNHLLLARTVELMQQFFSVLFPARETRVYDERAARVTHALPTPPMYEAVG